MAAIVASIMHKACTDRYVSHPRYCLILSRSSRLCHRGQFQWCGDFSSKLESQIAGVLQRYQVLSGKYAWWRHRNPEIVLVHLGQGLLEANQYRYSCFGMSVLDWVENSNIKRAVKKNLATLKAGMELHSIFDPELKVPTAQLQKLRKASWCRKLWSIMRCRSWIVFQ